MKKLIYLGSLIFLFLSSYCYSYVEDECDLKKTICIFPYKKKIPYSYQWQNTNTFDPYFYINHYKNQRDDSIEDALAFRELFVLPWDEDGGSLNINYDSGVETEEFIKYSWIKGNRDIYNSSEEETLMKVKEEYECTKGLDRIYFRIQPQTPSFMCAKTKPMGCSAAVGNPCSVVSGNKFLKEIDWKSKSSLLQFYRTYNSLNSDKNINDIGYGWSHNYDYQFKVVTYNGFVNFTLKRPDGALIIGKFPNEQPFLTPIKINNYLTIYKEENEWIVFDQKNNTKEFYGLSNDDFKINKITKNNITIFNFSYIGGILIEVKDHFNRKITFTYDNNLIKSILLPNDKSITYDYDHTKRLISISKPGYGKRKYEYFENGILSYNTNLLTSVIDEKNKVYAQYYYDEYSRGIGTKHANNSQEYKLTYYDNYTEVIDPYGTKTIYNRTFEAGNPLILNSEKNGNPDKNNTYDQAGNITQKTEKGLTTNYTYDLSRNLETSRTEAIGTAQERKIETTWHSDFPKPTEIKESSSGQVLRITTLTYDTNGNTLSKTITDPQTLEARTWSYEYNSFGQMTKQTRPDSTTTLYQYDDNGNLIKATESNGLITVYNAYNASGLPTIIQSNTGTALYLRYDDADRIIEQKQTVNATSLTRQQSNSGLSWWQQLVNAAYSMVGAAAPYPESEITYIATAQTLATQDAITQYQYDPRGLLVATTLPDGERIEYTYDDAHRLTEIKDQSGNRTVYTLNANGDITQTEVYGASGQLEVKNQQVYDNLGRLQKTLGNNQQSQTLAYDSYDQVSSDKNALNQSYNYSYDVLGRQIKETDPLNGSSQTEYDALDQIKKVIDAKGGMTSYKYNAFGEKIAQNSPDTSDTYYFYQDGQLRKKIHTLFFKHLYEYDAQGRMIVQKDQKITGNDQYEQTNFVYGPIGVNLGKLIAAKNKRSETYLNYNNLGLVRQKTVKYLTTQQSSAPTFKVQYSYTLGGKLKQLALPSGNIVNYVYNTTGQLTGIALNDQSFIHNIQYSANGLKGWVYSGVGDSVQFAYDLDGRITRINMPNVFDKNYSFDSADRILSITDSYQSLLNQSFKHDALSRLTEQMTAEKTFKYTYDQNSNRLTRQTVQGTTTNTENYTIASNSNRLINIQQGTSNKAYQYLATGQISNDGVRSYTYDAQGRSESISRSPNTILNAYDAFGQRIQKFSTTAGSQSQTLFVYDENGQLLGEYSPDGKVIREYIWLDETLVGLRSYQYPNEILRVHTDHLGTPRAISNNQNQVVWRWDGDQFGDVLPTGTLTFPIRHAGQYYDQEVNLFYNYFRDYDPITGRYIESDPIGLDGGLNTYGYVEGNPLGAVDPTGEAAIAIPPVIAAGAAIGAGAACYINNCGEVIPTAIDASKEAWDKIAKGMASPGNQADTAIQDAYNRECNKSDDKCEWLKKNAYRFPNAAVKATEKAWGCRHSRMSKDKKDRK